MVAPMAEIIYASLPTFWPSVAIIAAVLVALSVAAYVTTHALVVDQNDRVLTRLFGRHHRVLGPGLHLLWPFIEKPLYYRWMRAAENVDGVVRTETRYDYRVRVAEDIYDLPPITLHSKDNVDVTLNCVVYYRIDEPLLAIGTADVWQSIRHRVDDAALRFARTLDHSQLLQSQDALRVEIANAFGDCSKWGVSVTRLDVQSVSLPPAVMRAAEGEMAERRRSQASLDNAKLRAEERRVDQAVEDEVRRMREGTEDEIARKQHARRTDYLRTLREVVPDPGSFNQALLADAIGQLATGGSRVVFMIGDGRQPWLSLGGNASDGAM